MLESTELQRAPPLRNIRVRYPLSDVGAVYDRAFGRSLAKVALQQKRRRYLPLCKTTDDQSGLATSMPSVQRPFVKSTEASPQPKSKQDPYDCAKGAVPYEDVR